MQEPVGNRTNAILGKRLRKTLYYGKFSDASLPSFPMNDVAVDILNANTPLSPKKLEHNFASKVARKARISPCALMMGIIYSERLCRRNADALKKMSSSDLFLISVMVASKYLYDEGEEEEVFNDEWALAASYSSKEVNQLEMEFLAALDWNLFVDCEEFFNFVNRIESSIAMRQGMSRGWFSYVDLITLLRNPHYKELLTTLAQESMKMILVSSMLYTLGVASVLGTAAVIHTAGHRSMPVNTPCQTSYSSCTLSNAHHRLQEQAQLSCNYFNNHCGTRTRISHNVSDFPPTVNVYEDDTKATVHEDAVKIKQADRKKLNHTGNLTSLLTSNHTSFFGDLTTDDAMLVKRRKSCRLYNLNSISSVNRLLTCQDS